MQISLHYVARLELKIVSTGGVFALMIKLHITASHGNLNIDLTMLEHIQAFMWPIEKVQRNLIHDSVQTEMTLAEK